MTHRAGKHKLPNLLTDLLYPPRCPICGQPAPFGLKICPECRLRLPVIESKRCRKCGKPIEDFEVFCPDCAKEEHLYDRGLGIFMYDETMKRAISELKYKGRREYGEAFGDLLYENARSELMYWKPDCLIPIPLHPARARERGYNQALIISEALSARCGIPTRSDILVRTMETDRMKELSAKDRMNNLMRAFSASGDCRGVRRAVLIDDIYTTGATIDAASAVLRRAGIDEIYFLAVCIGGGFMVSY